ncbi:conserved hypothetical protein [Mesorhizobium plurifarium]|uniref:DUF4167 domain-containing protein n=1 Tax=Mesorhizobium plurifarium TaxID=69974 RepID=A0A090FL13_MESPL|nr:conserved hypothetical protein [Mesorhizobium plurifarium]
MRPQQQNRRMRGRNNNGGGGNNNNRKGPNPLTRTYESNGPDVKIRGSAQQIAEKYAALARDAQSSGDRVMAENYLQHAEHYNRIIAAAQAQMPIQNVPQNRDDFEDDLDEDRDEFDNTGNNSGNGAEAPANGSGPQPVIEGTPAELAYNQENGRDNNNRRDSGQRDGGQRDNNGRDRHRDRRNGGYGQNGPRGDSGQRGEHGGQQSDQNRRNEAQAQPEGSAEAGSTADQAPQFDSFSPAALAAQAELNETAMDNGAGRRPRRPRRPRGNYADQASNGERGAQPEGSAPENSGEAPNAVNNGDEASAKLADEARPAIEPVASEPTPVVSEAPGEPVTADANN